MLTSLNVNVIVNGSAVATLKVGVRGVNLAIFKLVAKVVRAKTVSSIVAALQAMLAIAKGVALFNVVTCLTAPVAHLAVVFAPGMYGMVTNSNLSPASSLALEVGSLVHVVVNAMAYAGNSIGGGKTFRASVHGKSFGL